MQQHECLVLCSGAGAPRRSRKSQLELSTFGRGRNIHLEIADITDRMVAPLPVALADLLEVATYVYCADQAFSRGGKRVVDYGRGWRRRFRFRIAVRLPELWSRPEIAEALVDGLSFMSDDTLEFEFCKLENPPNVSDYLKFNESTPNVVGIEEVCLFSGGLDSLAGAVKEILGDGRKVALVSHRSNPKVSKRQRTLVDMIDQRCPHAKRPLHIPIWIHKQGAPTRDYMQRTRSFLYASLAAVVAGMFDLHRIRFHENGTVSFNLPICAQVIGARATRTTHPRTLDAFAKLFSLLLGTDFRIDNPFLLKTRAEVAGSVRDAGQGDLIGHTVSCPHTHAMTTRQPHCGVCSQCIDRRFATLAAGCTDEDPGTGYRVDLFTGERKKTEDRTMIERYVGTANKIEAMSDAEQFCAEFPEVCDALRYVEGSADEAAAHIFDLYRRHAQQVRRVLKQEVVRHADNLINKSLPKICFLRIAVGADEGARRELRDAQKRGGKRRRKSALPAEQEAVSEEPAYIFKKDGQFWRLVFDGQAAPLIKDYLGLRYIAALLAKPFTFFSPYELRFAVHGNEPVPLSGSRHKIMDARAFNAYQDDFQRLKAELEEARASRDAPREERVQKDMRALIAVVSKSQKLGGRTRLFSDEHEKARSAVSKNIHRALMSIKAVSEPLWRHLHNSLSIGSALVYVPDRDIPWSL